MKNYFQVLKSNLPKLRDMAKASNVSILTDAVQHIKVLYSSIVTLEVNYVNYYFSLLGMWN